MSAVFADTSYFVALLNPRDDSHARAIELTRARPDLMYTTAWVLTELANVLSKTGDRERFVRTLTALRSDQRTIIIPPSEEMFEAGVDYYGRRPDKEWSLTDCISFIVMAERQITEAWTADHHFEQAGFVAQMT
jgi:hypothetical protein